jgi:hypothetical protein
VIPDLEDTAEETGQAVIASVAVAPAARGNAKVQSLLELDQALQAQLPSATGGGIDLGVLMSRLHPVDQVAELDEEWDFDTLLTQISHELLMDEASAAARAVRLAELQAKALSAPLSAATQAVGLGRMGTRGANGSGMNTKLSVGDE